jgi:hypothetical protein|tara:strand:+ start:23 stop:223 length:201 start_codon:yes stop_codon:yes gene_type:complete
MNAEDIASEIVNLTMVMDNQESLKEAWRVISQALSYLSSKDDFFTHEQRAIEMIGELKEKRVEPLV